MVRIIVRWRERVTPFASGRSGGKFTSMDDLWVAPPYRSACQALKLRTSAAFSRFFALDHVGGSKAVTLQAGVLAPRNGPEIPVFYKQYDYPRGDWRYAWRVSKARR